MIISKQNNLSFEQDPLFGKLSVILENDDVNERTDMLNFLYSLSSSNYLAFLDGEKSMIPFLSVEDNLLLGLSRKERTNFLSKMNYFLPSFRLETCLLKTVASDVSFSEQTLLQMIRSIILKKNIFIFDNNSNSFDNRPFLTNLLPILKQLTKSEGMSCVIVTKDLVLAESIYYDQCLLFNYQTK